ncbi:hypothetical protein LTR10_004923 [Elasticomyces elasticus]|nr:hypothetical protein LTR10_004923 [Elasticomyces elasticus]KAK4977238.1 hypothetical protein LTR42_003286 [Elasticomyces elasticus]
MSRNNSQTQQTEDIELMDTLHYEGARKPKPKPSKQKLEPWRSSMLRARTLTIVSVLQLAIVCSLATLSFISSRDNGFIAVNRQFAIKFGFIQGSMNAAFLWTTVPTLFMNMVALFWVSIVAEYASEMPLRSVQEGASMHKTVLLDYRRHPTFYVYVRAWKNGHRLLSCCMLSALVAAVVLGPFGARLFQVIAPTFEANVELFQRSFYNVSGLVPLIDYHRVIGHVSARRVYNGQWPAYTDGTYAVPNYTLPLPQAGVFNITEVSVDGAAYSATLSCRILQEYNISSSPAGDGQTVIELSANDRGCDISLKAGVGRGMQLLLKTVTNNDCPEDAGYSRIIFLAGSYSSLAAYLIDSMSVFACMPTYTTTIGKIVVPLDFSSLTFQPQVGSETDVRPTNWKQFEDPLIALSNFGDIDSPDFTSQFGTLMLEMIRVAEHNNVLDVQSLMDAASTAFSSAYAILTGTHLFDSGQTDQSVPGRVRFSQTRLATVPWSVYTSIIILALLLVLSVWLNIVIYRRSPMLAEEPRGLLGAMSILHGSNLGELLEDEEWRSAYGGRFYEWLKHKFILGQERCRWTMDGTIQVFGLVQRPGTPPPDSLL